MPHPNDRATAAPSADALARECALAMLEGDRVARALGIELVEAGVGRASLAMTVGESMLNGFGTCHGGVLFTLADTALACACNSHDERTVAHHCSVIYLRPGEPGERLTASAAERSKVGRVGVYDVSLKDSRGATVGEFLGHTRTIGGPVLDAAAGGEIGA
jgi:acyl-CoA thioesterase